MILLPLASERNFIVMMFYTEHERPRFQIGERPRFPPFSPQYPEEDPGFSKKKVPGY
jgi:hypothetical protein